MACVLGVQSLLLSRSSCSKSAYGCKRSDTTCRSTTPPDTSTSSEYTCTVVSGGGGSHAGGSGRSGGSSSRKSGTSYPLSHMRPHDHGRIPHVVETPLCSDASFYPFSNAAVSQACIQINLEKNQIQQMKNLAALLPHQVFNP